ncbi:F-box only protein 22 [Monomorium pharaonis]|uniref:F-box only protein 22 n=1 Tax=Monomorium pharaonis TaxID=307658 RepID=UPI00174701DB|nr:F-box only protein 22 [Monomorium pharaonis]
MGSVLKQVRIEMPSTSENDNATESGEKTLDPNIYLTYDILRIVFQYLRARDLANAAMVCRTWLEAANKEKWTRGPYCFMLDCKTKHDFGHHLLNVRVRPSIALFFLAGSFPYHVEEHCMTLLPKNCEVVMLYTTGMVMDNKELESGKCSRTDAICAFLPQIPNVSVKLFKLTEYYAIQKTTEYKEIISIIDNHGTSVSNNEMSTCFMLFCNGMGHSVAKRWASIIQKRKNKVTSVWGGVLDFIHFIHSCPENLNKRPDMERPTQAPVCIGVLIAGPVQTWSMILERKCNTKERVEERLKLFKNKVKLKKHSIGFMFVCRARGSEMYNETNVESTIFKRLFPKVPLAGCFGNGEFGKNSIDEANKEKNSEQEHKSKRSWYNEFSTVFLILTYG